MKDERSLERSPETALPDADRLISRLQNHPKLRKVFEPFIRWAAKNASSMLIDHPLFSAISEEDVERLQCLETLLERAQTILGMTEERFIRAFGFHDDLFTNDPEKIHDILAELLIVVDLADYGFSGIEKLPQWIKSGHDRLPFRQRMFAP